MVQVFKIHCEAGLCTAKFHLLDLLCDNMENFIARKFDILHFMNILTLFLKEGTVERL